MSGLPDDPVRASLTGAHAAFAWSAGRCLGYDPSLATFLSAPLDATGADWDDLACHLGPGAVADLFNCPAVPPADWEPVFAMEALQLVATGVLPPPDTTVEVLGAEDVPQMQELVERTRPGPFQPRTYQLGRYLGVRSEGRLIAMAGERLHPPGWTEISAVCTAPEARGRGLAAELVRAVADGVSARGERAFLHVRRTNTTAIDLYLRLGFEVHRETTFRGYRTPS